MDIKPVDQTVKTLLEPFFYRIPRFQRPYSWDRENVADFWNDAVASQDPDYFIGSFVVYRQNPATDTLLIVDGQQRITTITLLLAALRTTLHVDGNEDLARGIQLLIERPNLNNERQYVLQSESPYPYLQEYIQKLTSEDDAYLVFETLNTRTRAWYQRARRAAHGRSATMKAPVFRGREGMRACGFVGVRA